jgi:electron transfer flavoprotein beta subunit
LVSLGPKAKVQQVMMTVAQKAPFELVVPMSGRRVRGLLEVARGLFAASRALPGSINPSARVRRLQSASRGAGATLQIMGEKSQRRPVPGRDK